MHKHHRRYSDLLIHISVANIKPWFFIFPSFTFYYRVYVLKIIKHIVYNVRSHSVTAVIVNKLTIVFMQIQ